ncbi:MAG: trypsin-like peptidase domain-containing protein [Pleurocapsa sp. SU_5_0]|nr:trypsin-like peptidase domain-containing protein [Pleurocapsa sp. SU_5_0]NJR46258.1 trypsin-like peptidase domain-containing protein [Hyellaceae cyanobacterium CSU_1_1]
MKICRRQFPPKILNYAVLSLLNNYKWGLKILLPTVIICAGVWQQPLQTQAVPRYVLPDDTYSQDIYELAQSSTVRIIHDNAAGTGVIIYQAGQTYTVLTNWHVVGTNNVFQVMTADGQIHQLLQPPQHLGNFDLAIVQFQSFENYQVATIASDHLKVGEKVYAAGFPLYEQNNSSVNTISLGTQAFRLTQGEISLIPPKSLPEGYHLGYTNNTEIGMSGGPIFNTKGFLVGVHGRGKHRDPDFGVYTFEDGSEPTPEMLETMINSSWGIPISTYLQFTSQASQN